MGGKGKGTREGSRNIWKFVQGRGGGIGLPLEREQTDVAHRITVAYKDKRR